MFSRLKEALKNNEEETDVNKKKVVDDNGIIQ